MSKISRIEISDFRVYENKQVFSFEQKGILSNLVVIYAPNGYGKTSFFDAVEWAFSGKIKRFQHEQIQEEIQRREFANGNQILLTNRKSSKAGKEGVIKIVTATGKSLQRTVGSRKINNQNQRYDYRDGFLEGDFKQKPLTKLTNTNILTQDQIDSFLRFTSAEEKFNALSEFWPEGEAATLTYKNLTGYLRVIETDIAATAKRLGDIKKELKAFLNADQHIKTINDSIQRLTQGSVLEFSIDAIAHPVDKALYQSLRDTVSSFLKRGERQLETDIQLKTRLQELLDRHPAYLKNKADLVKENKNLKNLQDLERLYTDHRTVGKFYLERSQLSLEQTNRIGRFNELLKLIDSYKDTLKAISDEEITQALLLLENRQSLERLTTYRESLAALEENAKEQAEAIGSLAESVNTVSENFEQYQYWITQREKAGKELKSVEDLIAAKDRSIAAALERRRYLTNILESGNYAALGQAEIGELGETLAAYQQLAQSLAHTETALQQKQIEYTRSGSLDENLDKILSWGEEYVRDMDATHCPLCKTEFENVSELLNKIRSEKIAALKVGQQQEAIAALLASQLDYTNQLIALKLTIEASLKEQIELANAHNNFVYEEKDLLTGQRLDLAQQARHASDQAERLYELLRTHFSLDEPSAAQQPAAVKKRLNQRLEELKKKAARQAGLIAFKKDLIEGTENAIAVNRNRLTGLDNALGLLRSDAVYQKAIGIINELQLTTEQLDKIKLAARVHEMQAAADRVLHEVGQFRAQMAKLEDQINKNVLKIREEEIQGRKLQLDELIMSLANAVESFETAYFARIVAKEITAATIQEGLTYNINHIAAVEAENKRLQAFIIQLELINENVAKAALETEQAALTAKTPRLESAKVQLVNAKDAAAKYIDNEINNYFNKDVINQIYSRIEPHPDLNTIDFKPQITDHGPTLDVKATGQTDVLNPVLYLSAGQLNVLSLSIFLAKVFETGSELISTIFMDDPVQNLSDINILSFLDLIRSMVTTYDKQLVISSHDEHFYKLIQHKLPAEDFNATYIELEDFGKIKDLVP